MTVDEKTPGDTPQTTKGVIRTRWLNYRRKRFWVMIVFVLYTLLGFFAAPPLIKNGIVGLLQEDLGRPTSIEKIEVNPYMLSLRIQGFEVRDSDDARLMAFEDFFVNFQVASLLKWAWTFSQVELTGPYFHFERFATGDTRLDRLLADLADLQPVAPLEEPGAETANGVPRLLIRNLAIRDGRVDTLDNVPATPVELELSSVNIVIQELNTIPDHDGQQSVTIRLPDNASLKWNGSLDFVPLDSRGELILEGLHIDPLIAYLESVLPLESLSGILSSRLQYHLRQDGSGDIKLDVDDFDITLDDLLVDGLTPATEFIEIPRMSLLGGKLRYPEQSLYFGKLEVSAPRLKAWVNGDGSISMTELAPDTGPAPENTDAGDPQLPWRLGIGDVLLENGVVALTDYMTQPNAAVELSRLHIKMSGVSNGQNVSMPFELAGELNAGGRYSIDGDVSVLPELSMAANATTENIPLSLAQPYVQKYAKVSVKDGVLDSTLELNLPAGQAIDLGGALQVLGLHVSHAQTDEDLLVWDRLDVDRFDLDQGGLKVSQLTFEQPFGRIVINQDMSTNLGELVIEQPAKTAVAADPRPMAITVGGVQVQDGQMEFSDFSLPLPFATRIAGLGGSISTISTESTEPANIRLEGKVDDYGLARIEGSMNMLDPIRHTDVTVEFRNLLMSNLSPYTVAFAGHRIDRGKLDLGLRYSIESGQLRGANDVVLSDLELGEKVDHPEAANLPLGLAVSLLKDADGVIRIDLPVEGDVNDPEFRIGGVIWKAFTGLITKIVAAPFKLLGKLIGVDSEDLGQFEFLAGRADLTPPELEKIIQLEQALSQRPELKVEISGVTDRAIDVPALKAMRLRDIASERLENDMAESMDDNMMLDDEMRTVVEDLFAERFPETPPRELQAAHTAPPADDPEGKPVFDELAWAVDMWDRLLASEVISDQDLTDLANSRAESIRAGFLANGQVDESRIIIVEPKEVESGDGEWVPLELGVDSG